MNQKEYMFGSDPLKELWIAAEQELVEGKLMDFQGVQEAVSQETGGYLVPEGLKDQLGFGDLPWVLFEGSELTGQLYLGLSEQEPKNGFVSAAVGVIAVGEKFSSGNSVVRVSGFDHDMGRAIGVRYDRLYGVCDGFCVSVSRDELEYAGLNNSDLFVHSIPTKEDLLHIPPAIITRGMVMMTRDDQAFGSHEVVLSFPSSSLGLGEERPMLTSRGLTVSFNDDSFKLSIGYNASQDKSGAGAIGQLDRISIPSVLGYR